MAANVKPEFDLWGDHSENTELLMKMSQEHRFTKHTSNKEEPGNCQGRLETHAE